MVSRNDRAARALAHQLVRGVKDPMQRLKLVRDEVLRTIRPSGPSFLALPPGSLTSPDRTLSDQYGHPMDRAILLSSMLSSIGFRNDVVLAGGDTSGYESLSRPARETPQLHFFSFPLVRVVYRGKTIFLNSGDQYDEVGSCSLDRAPMLGPRGEIGEITVAPEFCDQERSTWSVTLDKSGDAHITVTNWFHGSLAGPFRKRYDEMLPEERGRHHLKLINEVSRSAESDTPLITRTDCYPPYIAYSLKAGKYASVDRGVLSFMLPEITGAVFPLRADTRVNPLFMEINHHETISCRVALPAGYTRLRILPEAGIMELPGGCGRVETHVELTENCKGGGVELSFRQEVRSRASEFSALLYPALLECNQRLTHPAGRALVAEEEQVSSR